MGDVEDAVHEALAAADAYMDAFNARDQQGMSAALNYPHVRIASGRVRIWETPEEGMSPKLFEYLEQTEGWDHSKWDHKTIVHAGPDKVHLDVQFTRYDRNDEPVGQYHSLWIATCIDGHWGIQARSSYAR